MHELPASIRMSLWLTRALRDSTPLEQAIVQALPDVDDIAGGLDQIELWRDFGERVVCVDLPRPGVHDGLLPPGSAAGEGLFVSSWGGVLVPELEIYGPAGDEGLKLTFIAHDGYPVPIHRLQALALPQIDRRFREALLQHVAVSNRCRSHRSSAAPAPRTNRRPPRRSPVGTTGRHRPAGTAHHHDGGPRRGGTR